MKNKLVLFCFFVSFFKYYLLTESEVITGKSQIIRLPFFVQYQYIKAEVWHFPVMTERTRLISYLLYGLFNAILEKNTLKTPDVIFHIHFRALRLSSSLILKKCLCASFSFSYWKYSCTLSIFSVVFAHAHVVLLTTQESRRAEKKFYNAQSLQENNGRSAANQSAYNKLIYV